MIRKSLTSVAATGALALGLVLGTSTTADAAVKGKDLPSKSNIVSAFPSLKGGQFAAGTAKKAGIPAKKCGTNKAVTVKSGRTLAGASASGQSVVTGVFEFKSTSAAKGAMAKYKKYVKKCKTFTVSGLTVKLSKDKAPKVGQDRLAMTAVTNYGGSNGYASSVIIRSGKRVATVGASDLSKVSKKKLNKLAKVAAKKMK
ncbi:hypothetical protein ASG90_10535 [Nocardioides sp. Soil797]|nr:hypothetical protein ASG90_10535 [Nocardioides sp. Soil797]